MQGLQVSHPPDLCSRRQSSDHCLQKCVATRVRVTNLNVHPPPPLAWAAAAPPRRVPNLMVVCTAAGAKKQDLVAKHFSEKNRALLLQAYQDAQADAAWCTKHSLQLLDPVMDNTGYIMRLCLRVRNHAQWQDLATQDIVTMRPRQVSKLEEVASGNARVPGTASGESSQTVRSPAPSVCDIPNVAV